MEGKVRVILSSHGKGEVWIDNFKVPKVRALKIEASASNENLVTLTILAPELEFEGLAKVQASESDG